MTKTQQIKSAIKKQIFLKILFEKNKLKNKLKLIIVN